MKALETDLRLASQLRGWRASTVFAVACTRRPGAASAAIGRISNCWARALKSDPTGQDERRLGT